MQERRIKQDFEFRPLDFNGQTLYCRFTADAKITTRHYGDGYHEERTADHSFDWIDIDNFEFAYSLEEAEEGIYHDANIKMYRAMEIDLELDEFTF